MKKNRIRLNESQLHRVIKESVNKVLRENMSNEMGYVRKTKDTFAIYGNYGYGWDLECYCEDLKDAKQTLLDYQSNGGGIYKIVKRREQV